MQGTLIETEGLTEIEVDLIGEKSGEGAEIHCRAGVTCTVDCMGNACANLDYYCYDGSDCILLCNGEECACDDETDNIDCPNMLEGDTTMNVITNEVLSVNDGIKYENVMLKLTPSIYGVLVI